MTTKVVSVRLRSEICLELKRLMAENSISNRSYLVDRLLLMGLERWKEEHILQP